jgi:hypothetical protein
MFKVRGQANGRRSFPSPPPPFFPASVMVISTRKTNSSTHPGAILQNNRAPRRSREQIEEDKARAAAKAIAAEEEAAAKYQSVLKRIAELKATAENDEHSIQAHTLRPDLGVSQDEDNEPEKDGEVASHSPPASTEIDEESDGNEDEIEDQDKDYEEGEDEVEDQDEDYEDGEDETRIDEEDEDHDKAMDVDAGTGGINAREKGKVSFRIVVVSDTY